MANSSNDNNSPPSSPINPPITPSENAGSPPPPAAPANELIQGLNSSSSSTTDTPPPPPPPIAIPSGPGGSSRGDGSSSGKKKKKRRKKTVEDDQQGSVVQKRKMHEPNAEPICIVCGRKFGSWKAVFGHFRAHPDRCWRGAFPPPTWDFSAWIPPSLPPEQVLAPTLLRLAHETLAKMRQGNLLSGAGSSARATLNFDLNEEPPVEEADLDVVGLPPPQGGEGRGLDLNLPPAEENEDEEMDHDD